MTRHYKNDGSFDQYVKNEVDNSTYQFDPSAWESLDSMLERHYATEVLIPETGSIFGWLRKMWKYILSGIIIMLGVSTVLLNVMEHESDKKTVDHSSADVTEWTMAPSAADKPNEMSNTNGSLTSIESGYKVLRARITPLEKLPHLEVPGIAVDKMPTTLHPWQPPQGKALLDKLQEIQEEKKAKHLVW